MSPMTPFFFSYAPNEVLKLHIKRLPQGFDVSEVKLFCNVSEKLSTSKLIMLNKCRKKYFIFKGKFFYINGRSDIIVLYIMITERVR